MPITKINMRFLKTKFALFLIVFVTVASSLSNEVLATWNFSSFLVPDDVVASDAYGSAVDVSGDWAIMGSNLKDSRSGVAYILHKDVVTGKFDEYKKLLTSDTFIAKDNFGFSVAIDGDYAVVGAYGRTKYTGAVYLFSKNQGGDDNWGFVKKITIPGAIKGDYFGRAVDLDGDNLVASAFNVDGKKGAAYVFSKEEGGAGNWGLVKKMVSSDGVAGDYLGDSIAISGENVVVGSYRDNAAAGSVYIFSKNQGGENNYGELKRLSASDQVAAAYFGYTVDIDGENVVVGAYQMNSRRGAVYVFSKDQGGSSSFGQVKKITASDTLANDIFGYSVKLDGTKLVVGALGKLSSAGATYLFDKDTGGAGNWGQILKLPADGLVANDKFGFDIAIAGGYIFSVLNGSDKVVSDGGGVNIYHYNNPPVVISLSGTQSSDDKKIKITYGLSDLDGETATVDSLQYSLDDGVNWVNMEGDVFVDDAVGNASYDLCISSSAAQTLSLKASAKDVIDTGEWTVAEAKIFVDCKAPVVSSLAALQIEGSDDVQFSYDLADDSDVVLVEVGISDDGGQNWEVVPSTISGDIGENIVQGVGKEVVWKAGLDIANSDKGSMMFRVRATDKFGNIGEYLSSSVFSLDTKAPAFNGAATIVSEPSVNVTLNWEPIEDSNFGFYEIWYGTNADDVKIHSGTAELWDMDSDLVLSTLQSKKTTITGLDYSTEYYFEIWAFDSFGHKSLVSELSILTPEKPVYTNTVYQEKKIYIYQQSDTSVSVSNDGEVSSSNSSLKPETLEVPESVQVVDGVFRVPEDLKSASSEVFEIKDDLNNLSLYIPSDAEITLGGKEKFYGNIFKPVIESSAPLVSEGIAGNILLTINADTSADESVYFSKPVIVTFDLENALSGANLGSNDLLVYFYDKTKEKYDYVSDLAVSLDGKTAAFLTYHFSTFVVMEGSVESSPLVNNDVPFEDVVGHWSESYVDELYLKGILNGKGYRKFAPADPVSRAEFLKIALMAFDYDMDSVDLPLPYSDVAKDHWAYKFIGLADRLGLVSGYGEGVFAPDKEISRAEALKILVTVSGQVDDFDEFAGVSKFLDVESESWYLPYLNYAFSKGVVSGYGNGLFGPGNNLTRAEAAKMVGEILELKSA